MLHHVCDLKAVSAEPSQGWSTDGRKSFSSTVIYSGKHDEELEKSKPKKVKERKKERDRKKKRRRKQDRLNKLWCKCEKFVILLRILV